MYFLHYMYTNYTVGCYYVSSVDMAINFVNTELTVRYHM